VRRFFREQVRPYLALQAEIGLCMGALVVLELLDPLVLRAIIDRALGDGDAALLAGLCGLLLAVMVFRIGFRVISVWLYSYSGLRILFDFRHRVFRHVEELSPYALRADRAGDTLARVTSDIDVLQRAAAHTFTKAVQDLLTIAGIVALLLWLDTRLTLLLLAVYPVLVFVLVRLNRRVHAESERARDAVGGLYAFLEERLGAIRVIQEFRRQRAEAGLHVRASRPVISSNLALSVWASGQISLADTMTTAAFVLVFLVGGRQVLGGHLSLGTLVAFYTLATRLQRPVALLIDVNVDLQMARAALARVYELLDREPDVRDRPGAAAVAREAVRGEIAVERVGLTWPDGTTALRGVTIGVPAGGHLALVGPSGGGKSTLAAVLARFLDPQAGRVTLDGRDLRDLTLASLRSAIALVPQETQLFHASIADNLRVARRAATDEDLWAVLRVASLEGFVAGLPDGLGTEVGEEGLRLSGGERQRLALARALLKDPRVIILDEATSALDPPTERAVLEGLRRAARGRTLVTVAHRLATVTDADLIAFVAEGRIVAVGKHAELLTDCVAYRNSWRDGQPSAGRSAGALLASEANGRPGGAPPVAGAADPL